MPASIDSEPAPPLVDIGIKHLRYTAGIRPHHATELDARALAALRELAEMTTRNALPLFR